MTPLSSSYFESYAEHDTRRPRGISVVVLNGIILLYLATQLFIAHVGAKTGACYVCSERHHYYNFLREMGEVE